MSTDVDLPSTSRPTPPRFTVDDYHRLARSGRLPATARVELVEGEIVDLVPIGSAHAGAVNRIDLRLKQALADVAIIAVQQPLRLGRWSEPQPDLCVLRPREDFYSASHPNADDALLVVEVAESSLERDLGVKVPLYARHAVRELWLVDLTGRRVLAFREPRDDGYAQTVPVARLEAMPLGAFPDRVVDLGGLFGPP